MQFVEMIYVFMIIMTMMSISIMLAMTIHDTCSNNGDDDTCSNNGDDDTRYMW